MADRDDRLVDDLTWHAADEQRRIVALDGVPVAAFELTGSRVITLLALLRGDRFIDVTTQPHTVGQLIRGAAIRRRRDPNAWEGAVTRGLSAAGAEWAIDDPPTDRTQLAPVAVSLGFPIVRKMMDRGVDPPPFVPRWAEPVLACADARSAAVAAFGSNTTRRVVRTMPASLLGDPDSTQQQLALIPLAMAMALTPIVDADQVANVLSAPVAVHQPRHWPTVDQLHTLRRAFADFGAEAALALSLDALTQADGLQRLATLAPQLTHLQAAGVGVPPMSLTDLEREVTDIQRPRPVPPAPARPRRQRAELPAAPRNPPPAPARPAEDVGVPFHYSASVRSIDGACLGHHQLVLPHDQAELQQWTRTLHNCLADYGPAVAAGRTVVFGLRHGERLVAALEFDPGLTTVRQFVRDHNRAPLPRQRDAVRAILQRHGIGQGRTQAAGA